MVDMFSGSSIERCKVTSEGLPPFQPPRTISRKFLSLKTVFLLALASGRRGSEIHALSGRVWRCLWALYGSAVSVFFPISWQRTSFRAPFICLLSGPRGLCFPKCWACLWHTEHCSPLVLFLPLKHNSNCSCQRLQLCPSAHLLCSPTWLAVGLFFFVLNTATSSDIIDSHSLLVTSRLLCWRLSVVEVCPVPTVSWTHSVFGRVQP